MKKVLSHSKTRWLSLYPCIERVLQLFSALKSYFLSEKDCPLVLHNFFKDEKSEFWMLYVHATAQIFHNTIKKIEASDITGLEVNVLYHELLNSMRNRLENSFIPFTALNVLNTTCCADKRVVEAVSKNFFSCIVSYLETWEKRLVNHKSKESFFLNKPIVYEEFAECCHSILKTDNTIWWQKIIIYLTSVQC